ncbi:MAG TPA: hypothetical protein VHY09_03550 [Candidatus Methylacidiphilales bacterium]|nr:hypothetical protein [Candidatus Methylacidiphilales bacterium]
MLQMPAFSQWTIDYTYSGDAPPKPTAPGAPPAPLSRRPVRVTVTKTDPISHQEEDFEQGLRADTWSNGDVVVEQKPGNPQLNAYLPGAADKNTDFPQFNWVSKANFTGIRSQQGRKCLVFKASLDIFEILNPQAFKFGLRADHSEEATAYVDLKTRYPVSLQFGPAALQYTFQPPPTAPLEMPDEFAAAAKALKIRLQAAQLHPARP